MKHTLLLSTGGLGADNLPSQELPTLSFVIHRNKGVNNVKIHPQATKGHLMVGVTFILLSLGSFVAGLFLDSKIR
jgi:hypothetical protein